jgi:hypothetical protein
VPAPAPRRLSSPKFPHARLLSFIATRLHRAIRELIMPSRSIAFARLAVGIGQGVALWYLQRAFDAQSWPATDGFVFAPLMAIAILLPIIVVTGLGNLRSGTLAVWTVAATVLCAGLAVYDIFRDPTGGGTTLRILPGPELWLVLIVMLFIGNALIVSGDADRRLITDYSRHFDVSWKLAVQLTLAAAFVGVFWGVLWLGAELFRLIKIEFLAELIQRRWFWIPVTTLVLTYALHTTDVRAGLVRGTRTLALTLLAWLLPVMTLLTVAFLVALPFTGLQPLWDTRHATALLLIAAGVLVFLLNAAYQDGQLQEQAARVVRYAGTAAAITLVPLVALAAYGLELRIEQYGWTPDRVIACACLVVAACYAVGYAAAALRPGPWLKWVEGTNLATALVILAVLLSLSTPIADAARISVKDQLARLARGKTSVEQFDFAFLRFKSGRYGLQALERLSGMQEGSDAVRISQKAKQALDWRNRRDVDRDFARATPQSRAANITVLGPAPNALPDSFLQQDWDTNSLPFHVPQCLTGNDKCEAIMSDLDGDGTPEILLFGGATRNAAFKRLGDGRWIPVGSVLNADCSGVRDALRAGKFEVAAPRFKDIEADGRRLRVNVTCQRDTSPMR